MYPSSWNKNQFMFLTHFYVYPLNLRYTNKTLKQTLYSASYTRSPPTFHQPVDRTNPRLLLRLKLCVCLHSLFTANPETSSNKKYIYIIYTDDNLYTKLAQAPVQIETETSSSPDVI